ncbi:CBS domain-containing protein CBSX1, chloroplastic-like [Bidens hawaiensis]|uniref:CBS domain-containing protein CBSX1, chloroplastic-like n=1 Tax=Bidens hawaiensis TaxID=980011 RepID=UPI00404B8F1B
MASIPQLLRPITLSKPSSAIVFNHQLACLTSSSRISTPPSSCHFPVSTSRTTLIVAAAAAAAEATLTNNSLPPRNGALIVGDFMTRKNDLHVVKPTTTVDEALEALVQHRITGFPVIDDDWKLVGLVSDYDLLALDSVSGAVRSDTDMFPEVDSTWKTFNEVQKLLNKTDGKVVGDLMTPAPLVVRENTNLEDAARLLLETKYRRLPVVDGEGKLVGIITRGNVVRAALQIKKASESKT